jgi:hypothetical protein
MNTKLNDGAIRTIAVTLARLGALATNLSVDEEEFREANFANGVSADFVRTVSRDISAYGETLSTLLREAEACLNSRNLDAALDLLLSAHAMTMAQMVSLDIASVDNGHASLTGTGVTPLSPGGGGAVANLPPASLLILFGRLEKIGAWLSTIIQTLLTPKITSAI